MVKKLLFRIPVSLIILALMIWFGGRFILSFSQADYDGDVIVEEISETVDITYDAMGIPQIWAESDEDMYFALGWAHASERLFHMEMIRRYAAGTLSEIFGEIMLGNDIKQRRLGFGKKAAADIDSLEPGTRQILERYCAGVNAWIDHKTIMPFEFILLGLTPDRWQPEDCLSIFYYQSWFAHELMDYDRTYHNLIDKFGTEILPYLKRSVTDPPVTVPDKELRKLVLQQENILSMTKASNSWAVSPAKSESGYAVHASDPHLVVNLIPGFWYIAGIHSAEGTNVLGVTVPGLPLIAMGHNDSIAYSFTVASIDLIDYYRELRNPEDSMQVLTPHGYKNIDVREEKFVINQGDSVFTLPMYFTELGPAVHIYRDSLITLHWAGFDFNIAKLFNRAIKLNTADNFEEFRAITTGLGALDVNWIYSDSRGNIGYQLCPVIPVRDYYNTFSPLPAEDSAYHWQGYHLPEESPYLLNPPENYVANSNNDAAPERNIPGFYAKYRIKRIRELLESDSVFSAEEIGRMQYDLVSPLAKRWKGLLYSSARRLNRNELAMEISEWNGSMTDSSEIAALFKFWRLEQQFGIFKDQLGDEWFGAGSLLDEALSVPLDSIIDDVTTEERENVLQISSDALERAIERHKNKQLGDIITLTAEHPLSQVEILDHWLDLNRGPYPAEGSATTLDACFMRYDRSAGMFKQTAGPSMRYLLDWAEPDSFKIILSTGQSGNPFSDHYDDFIEYMRTGKRWTVPFTDSAVYNYSRGVFRLIPSEGN